MTLTTSGKFLARTGGALLIAAVSFGSATADDMNGSLSAEESYQIRNGAMEAIAGHMKALGAVAKGEAQADAGTPVHAMSLNALAKTVPSLFMANATTDKSRAKPEIWSDWEGFKKAADDFAMATGELAEAAKSGDAGQIGAALGGVGKTCGGCHKPFRAPKN
ncbi:MAG: cytochrome c [Alphaproteobacteria bacterium]|nr:cytochrome c [Alphaproteobacteria bacterium]